MIEGDHGMALAIAPDTVGDFVAGSGLQRTSPDVMLKPVKQPSGTTSTVGVSVSYETKLDHLLDRYPQLGPALARHGITGSRFPMMCLDEVAEQLGVPRERLVLVVAGALIASTRTRSCGGDCDACESSAHTEGSCFASHTRGAHDTEAKG